MKQMLGNYELQLDQQAQLIKEYEIKTSASVCKEKSQILHQFESLKSELHLSHKIEDEYLAKI